MAEERTLILGMDLCDEVSQLAVYDRELMEPVLMGQSEDNPDALIETAVELNADSVIRGFLDRVRTGESIDNNGKEVEATRVLAYFFKKTFSLTRGRYPGEKIKMLVITVPSMDKDFVDRIYESLALIGLESDRVRIIDHKRSYIYYVLYQKKELWSNDVGLFDHDGTRLIYEQLQIDRSHTPALVGVTERDFTDVFSASEEAFLASPDADEGGMHPREVAFENIVHGALRNQYISSLFMTGEGFEEEWADHVFPRLAVGRRLFRGRNLYVSGAVYAAKEFGDKRKLDDYVVFAPDMVGSFLTMEVYENGRIEELELARAGDPWFDVDTEVDLIPDGDTEIVIHARPVFGGDEQQFILDITPVAGKTDRMCRLGVRVRFEDVGTAVFTIRDKGFGETMPGSNRVWEETITCS